MKTFIVLALFATSSFAQATFPIQIPGEAAVSVTLSAQAVPSVTSFIKAATASGTSQVATLNGAVLSTDTAIAVSSAAGVTTGMGLVTESEVSLITAVNGNTLTVSRHTLGTAAATHASGTSVTFLRSGSYSVFIANLVADVVRANMTTFPSTTIATANTAIATQEATINSTVSSGVTHTP